MANVTDPKFQAALSRAAKKAGINVEHIKSEHVCTDRTWGDRCGVVFYGGSPELNERVARFFLAWLGKHAGTGSYDAQRSVSYQGRMYFTRFTNGVAGWYAGALPDYAPRTLDNGFVLRRLEGYEGVAVNTTYYPCAD